MRILWFLFSAAALTAQNGTIETPAEQPATLRDSHKQTVRDHEREDKTKQATRSILGSRLKRDPENLALQAAYHQAGLQLAKGQEAFHRKLGQLYRNAQKNLLETAQRREALELPVADVPEDGYLERINEVAAEIKKIKADSEIPVEIRTKRLKRLQESLDTFNKALDLIRESEAEHRKNLGKNGLRAAELRQIAEEYGDIATNEEASVFRYRAEAILHYRYVEGVVIDQIQVKEIEEQKRKAPPVDDPPRNTLKRAALN